jgi:hypothetical protein
VSAAAEAALQALPEGLLDEVRSALDEDGTVARVLLRSRPGGGGRDAAHAVTVVFADPSEDGAARRALAEPLLPILHPLLDALGSDVGVRWPSARALGVLEDDNVVVYERGA